jgi:tRNA threonylcarbamoyladenosine biosynthesis protein TsaE
MQLIVKNLGQLPQAAQQVLAFAKTERNFLFYGDMGAGKTTLIKEICKQLGTNDTTSSPTFSIINEYKLANQAIFHFDFYRLKNQSEAFDLGYEDYFYADQYCLIEWPEKIPDLLPPNYIKIELVAINENERCIDLTMVKSSANKCD